MDRHRAAHEMNPLAGGGQLQGEVLEDHGVVVAHGALMLGRAHQLSSMPASWVKALSF